MKGRRNVPADLRRPVGMGLWGYQEVSRVAQYGHTIQSGGRVFFRVLQRSIGELVHWVHCNIELHCIKHLAQHDLMRCLSLNSDTVIVKANAMLVLLPNSDQ